jgi:hypothetical protein
LSYFGTVSSAVIFSDSEFSSTIFPHGFIQFYPFVTH